jgi:hypothetical protein
MYVHPREAIMLRIVPLLTALVAFPVKADVIDQKTYELVVTLARTQALQHGYGFAIIAINSVSIIGLNAPVDMSNVEPMPEKIEESSFRAINCDAISQMFKRDLTVETTRSTTVEISNTIGATNDFKFGISFGGKFAKFNAESDDKQTFSATNKSSQTVSARTTEKWPEDRTIPPKTMLHIRLDVIKGLVRAPIHGTIVFDADFLARLYFGSSGLYMQNENWKLGNGIFAPTPALRTTNFDGFIYGETFENIRVIYASKPVDPDSPECKIPLNMQPLEANSNPKLLFLEGELATDR